MAAYTARSGSRSSQPMGPRLTHALPLDETPIRMAVTSVFPLQSVAEYLYLHPAF
jgi:hypothetical protein